MSRRLLSCYLIAASLVGSVFVAPAGAALSPETIKEMKAEATDLVEVKITKVTRTGRSGDELNLVYSATVTKVDRSKSGIKAGDSIEISSYRVVSLVPRPGPKNPPLLKAGWTGKVYLNAPEGRGPYKIAVYGHSFVAKGE
ncbi:MAG: hypothetical protein MI757_04270 [Pirellulales bacterium]|nr:hypothetical protein [Pirellulales bacterium]